MELERAPVGVHHRQVTKEEPVWHESLVSTNTAGHIQEQHSECAMVADAAAAAAAVAKAKKNETYITSQFNVLPPCNVCQEKSSGMHYGVNTCEGCKGFFRRCSQKSDQDFQCIFGDGNCIVQGNNRNKCQYCRYKKCLAVGMSKGAIKIGRYTKELKIRNMEIAQQQQTLHPANNSIQSSSSSSSSSSSAMLPDSSSPTHQMSTSPCATERLSPVQNKESPFCGGGGVDDVGNSSNNNDALELAAYLLQNHCETCNYCDDLLPGILEKQRQNLRYYGIYEAVEQGTCVPFNDDLSFPHQIEKIQKRLPSYVQLDITYAKHLPGFETLNADDQQRLLKSAIYENFLIISSRTFNSEFKVWTLADGMTIQANPRYKGLYEAQLWQLDFTSRLNSLNLTDREICLLRAIIILQPGRPDLNNPQMVRELQDRIVCSLQTLLLHHYPNNGKQKFEKIMHLIQELLEYGDSMSRRVYSVKVDATTPSAATTTTPPPTSSPSPPSVSSSSSLSSSQSSSSSFSSHHRRSHVCLLSEVENVNTARQAGLADQVCISPPIRSESQCSMDSGLGGRLDEAMDHQDSSTCYQQQLSPEEQMAYN